MLLGHSQNYLENPLGSFWPSYCVSMEVLSNSSDMYLLQMTNTSTPVWTLSMRYKDMSAVIYFYLVLQSVSFFLGTPANAMVLWLLHKNEDDTSTSDNFIWNLAVMDMIFCLVLPVELTNMIQSTSHLGYIMSFFCAFKNSASLLTCICFDYYLAVIHPITFIALKDRKHRMVCTTIIWLITLAYATIQLVVNIPHFDKVFMVMILGTFAIMVFCNFSILRALMHSGPGWDEMHPVKKTAFGMVLIILAIIVFNYQPVVIVIPLESFFAKDVFQCYISCMVFGFMDISSTIQPMLYLFKKNLSNMHCCCG
ncbi:proteinase-activated receptor 3-like [Arapaima gigas]